MFKSVGIVAFLGAAGLCFGCSGSIGDGQTTPPGTPGDPSTPPGTNPPPGTPPPPPNNTGSLGDATTVPGPAPLRRLTRTEYENTIKDLLGVSNPAAVGKLTPDQGSGESGFVKGGSITGSNDARNVMSTAEEITTAALPRLAMLLPCGAPPSAAADQDACADKFVTQFGLRAFRRPLTSAEDTELKALYRAHRKPEIGDTFEQAIGAVITAMLQTPQFLYHWESGAQGPYKEGQVLRYGPYELASRLSYLFWASMPDEPLFVAAGSGKLASPDDVAREARRLLAHEKAGRGLQEFFMQWLEIGELSDMPKDPMLTQYTPALSQSMTVETRDFITALFLGAKADGKLETLLTSTSTVIDAGLAKLYGVAGVTGTARQPAQLDATKRAGVFTQASFLTAKADAQDSHPVLRGDAILRRVLCTELIIPPDLVVPPIDEPKAGQTTRERFEVHEANPCATCHKLIDPIGFALEHYDAIGAYRTMDRGKPVNSKATFNLGSVALTFDGGVEMMTQLSKTKEARDCMATQWLRYVLGRRELQTEDPSLSVLRTGLAKTTDLRELMVAATRTRTFTHRTPSAGEVTP